MISKFIKGKTSVFIDASNVYYSQKKVGWLIDFEKMKNYFQSQSPLVNIYYYTARDVNSEKQEKFLRFLEGIGYLVRSKNIKFIKDSAVKNDNGGYGFFKGNLDVELTIDVLENKDEYGSLVLISGDSDFEPLLKLMKSKYSKKCLVIATKHSISIELIRQAKFINLNKLSEYFKKV